MSLDVRPFVSWIVNEYEPAVRVSTEAGAYASVPGSRTIDLYGASDLACVLWSIRRLRPTDAGRRAWAEVFAGFADPLTGRYVEKGKPSHVDEHVTAYAIAAMELLDLEVQTLRWADSFRSPRNATAFLDALDWRNHVYLESHRGAGAAAIVANVPSLRTPSWFAAFFAAIEAHLDPASGMFGDGKPPTGDLDQIGGTFHYAFLYEWANRPLPHPEARIDAVLALQREDGLWDPANPFWLTLDGVYLLTRAVRRSGHRRAEVDAAVRRSLDAVALLALDEEARPVTFGASMGSHTLVAVVSLLAEAQQHLGADEVVSDLPLRLVLDRRPFI